MLEELIEEREFREPLARNDLCIQHAQLVLQIWKDRGKRVGLFEQLKSRVSELAADLREFIRKHDYQYRNEPLGARAGFSVSGNSVLRWAKSLWVQKERNNMKIVIISDLHGNYEALRSLPEKYDIAVNIDPARSVYERWGG
jgi:hypothetical protein